MTRSSNGIINETEAVQRRFTKRISGLSSYSYEAYLALLGLESLEARHIKADLLTVLQYCYT